MNCLVYLTINPSPPAPSAFRNIKTRWLPACGPQTRRYSSKTYRRWPTTKLKVPSTAKRIKRTWPTNRRQLSSQQVAAAALSLSPQLSHQHRLPPPPHQHRRQRGYGKNRKTCWTDRIRRAAQVAENIWRPHCPIRRRATTKIGTANRKRNRSAYRPPSKRHCLTSPN